MTLPVRRVAIIVTLGLSVAALAAPLLKQAHTTRSILRDSIRALLRTTFEERRRWFYGDCDKHGYGYIRRMMQGYPAAESAPVLRNPLWDPRIVPVVLPGFRWRPDERVLIGAGLTEDDAHERRIAHAMRLGTDSRGVDEWRFATNGDVDTLTGFLLAFPPTPAITPDAQLNITILHSPEYPNVVGHWRWPLTAAPRRGAEYRLPQPLVDFSIGRGGVFPFIVKVEARGGPLPERIDILGLTVDLRDYVVVHRERNCFTAIRAELIQHGNSDVHGAWAEYVATLRAIGTR